VVRRRAVRRRHRLGVLHGLARACCRRVGADVAGRLRLVRGDPAASWSGRLQGRQPGVGRDAREQRPGPVGAAVTCELLDRDEPGRRPAGVPRRLVDQGRRVAELGRGRRRRRGARGDPGGDWVRLRWRCLPSRRDPTARSSSRTRRPRSARTPTPFTGPATAPGQDAGEHDRRGPATSDESVPAAVPVAEHSWEGRRLVLLGYSNSDSRAGQLVQLTREVGGRRSGCRR
jgi:hypothetical protein